MSKRLSNLKTVLWALVGVLASVTVIRFVHGLGAVTNLSDAAPWGLWIEGCPGPAGTSLEGQMTFVPAVTAAGSPARTTATIATAHIATRRP